LCNITTRFQIFKIYTKMYTMA